MSSKFLRPIDPFLMLILSLIIEFLFCISQIFYFIGFAFFCLESVVSIWVIQVSFLVFRNRKDIVSASVSFSEVRDSFNTWNGQFYVCSKYTCTSEGAGKQMRWKGMLREEPWELRYDAQMIWTHDLSWSHGLWCVTFLHSSALSPFLFCFYSSKLKKKIKKDLCIFCLFNLISDFIHRLLCFGFNRCSKNQFRDGTFKKIGLDICWINDSIYLL